MRTIAFPNVISPHSAQTIWLQGQLAAFERFEPAAQAHARDHQLAALISHAKRYAPYWRDVLAPFNGSFKFDELPLLSRATLQAHGKAMRCEEGTPLPYSTKTFVSRTSGSTGTPVEVAKCAPLYDMFYQAQALRSNAWYGVDTKRDVIAIRDAKGGIKESAWGSVIREVGRTGRAAVCNMVEHSPEEIWEWLQAHTSPYLVTTGAMVLQLARIALADKLRSCRFDLIMTFGEAIRPEHRQAAKEAFGARIVDRYSSEEVGWMAFQCPKHDHYHALTATTHVEIVDDDNRPVAPGEEGRVLVTSMHSYAMPIIRYAIGDRAIAGGECDCGLRLPVIKEILGRERSFVELPDGTSRLARLTGECWRSIAPVTEYRVVQYRDSEVEAFVTAERPLSPQDVEAMENMLRDKLHASLKVRVTPVESIAWGSRWKRIDVVRVDHLRGEPG